jgi:hypothetical protein
MYTLPSPSYSCTGWSATMIVMEPTRSFMLHSGCLRAVQVAREGGGSGRGGGSERRGAPDG